VLLERGHPALAYAVAETGLAADPGFSALEEKDSVSLVSYALDTGRRRAATQLLDNYLQRSGAGHAPGPQLAALQTRLQPAG
jgi:hypothetical protein